MNPKNSFLLLLWLAALLPARADFAHGDSSTTDTGGDVRVDVVVDMTDAGKKIPHPTTANPAYYLPLPAGKKDIGDFVAFYQKAPPSLGEVTSLLIDAMSGQGYRLATKQSPPSLVLIFYWGYMQKELLGGKIMNQDQLLSMVAGDTLKKDGRTLRDGKPFGPYEEELINWATSTSKINRPRWYLLASAYDFQDWLRHRSTLLWRAHISTELWGHYFEQVLPTLVATAVPLFGRETTEPQIVRIPYNSPGRVIIGTPEVKDYPETPPGR